MSEANYGNKNTIHIPHSLEELWGYFQAKEELDPTSYAGYADLAALAADSIELARRYGRVNESAEVPLALIPGRPEGIYLREHTPQSKELMELILAKLEPAIDETTETDPHGRILWQSSEPGVGINLIQTRWRDARGELEKLTAVSEVPEDLLYYSPEERVYTEAEQRAIKISQALQRVASKNPQRADEAKNEYFDMVIKWPVVTEGIPPEELAA